jgi:DNA-directed RNA polymerase III subunit RPC11
MDRRISKHMHVERKEVDDVLGGEEAWKNTAKTAAACERCVNFNALIL